MTRSLTLAVLAAALVSVTPPRARADEPSIPRRAVPDYDGRAEAGPSAEEALVWIPRVLLWPLHAIVEFVLRRPLGWLLTTAEHERWDVLQIPPFVETAPTWGLTPTVFVDFGFQPSGGVYVWANDVLFEGNDLRAQLGFGGVDWLRATLTDRVRLGPNAQVELSGEGWARPDHVFMGSGPDARADRVARYGRRRLGGRVTAVYRPWRASQIRVTAGVRANELYDTTYLDDGQRTLSDAAQSGWLGERGASAASLTSYTSYWQRLDIAIDTREPHPANGSGVRVEAHGELALDVFRPLELRWARWGGAAGAFWDVDAGRTLGVWVAAELASALGTEPVPFTELPDFGARGRMSGFRNGWIVGESVISATLEYRYPIWVSVEGLVHVSIGNAFGSEFEGFDMARMRMSYAFGLRTIGDPDQALTIQAGCGTETFERGGGVVVYRLTVGMQEGF